MYFDRNIGNKDEKILDSDYCVLCNAVSKEKDQIILPLVWGILAGFKVPHDI
jgi:hypothetical protein